MNPNPNLKLVSEPVTVFDDELKEIAKEIVRNDSLDKVIIGLDYFDASINGARGKEEEESSVSPSTVPTGIPTPTPVPGEDIKPTQVPTPAPEGPTSAPAPTATPTPSSAPVPSTVPEDEKKGYIELVKSFGLPYDEKKRIPFTRMIYFGDGETDVPCMKIVNMFGGNSIAVYNPEIANKKAVAEKLHRQGRVNFIAPAVYTKDSKAFKIVCSIIDKIKADSDLEYLSK